MCGLIGSTGPRINRTTLNDIHHRGPDSRGLFCDENISMGHTRLEVIDPENGSQPRMSEEVVLVFNGEIYNYLELRCNQEKSDTEVLLQYYRKHGIEKTLRDINGMFSFALYDKKKGKLFLVRDRLGIKPMHYFHRDGELVFCSEIEPIKNLVGSKKLSIDKLAVSVFFSLYYIPSPLTIWKEIRSLRPGHYVEYDISSDSFCDKEYWSLPRPTKNKQSLDDLENLLSHSVRLRTRSDVPYGAYLSGGVDSSLIVKCMSDLDEGVSTFTAQINDEKLDESSYAAYVASVCETDHTNLEVNYGDITLNFLRKISANFGQPFADSSIIPTYLISKKISENVTVALGGDGADELFCGYNKYSHIEDKKEFKFFRNDDLSFLNKGYVCNNILYLSSLLPYSVDSDIELMRLLDIHVFLEGDILQKVDRTSMANSLEVRVPFLDHRIVELSNNLNYDILYGKPRKAALKNILSKYFPEDFVKRPKIGFMLNMGGWVDKLFSRIKSFKVFEDNIFVKDFNFSGVKDNYLKFAIIMFSLWYEDVYA